MESSENLVDKKVFFAILASISGIVSLHEKTVSEKDSITKIFEPKSRKVSIHRVILVFPSGPETKGCLEVLVVNTLDTS